MDPDVREGEQMKERMQKKKLLLALVIGIWKEVALENRVKGSRQGVSEEVWDFKDNVSYLFNQEFPFEAV